MVGKLNFSLPYAICAFGQLPLLVTTRSLSAQAFSDPMRGFWYKVMNGATIWFFYTALWRKITEEAKANDAIASSFTLCCVKHGNKAVVSKPAEFKEKAPIGNVYRIFDVLHY